MKQHRTLLVLDGIEPLQHPPNSPQAGELKDEALAALLQGLAMDNPGLCLVTSREPLKNLETFQSGGTVEEKPLDRLSRDAAVALLRHLGVGGTEAELEAAWEDVGGHALTLQLLGRFLADAHGGDIRKRREVDFETADQETPGRTAMKVMQAYENWLASAGPERQRDLAVLRLTGLFDRPADPGCLAALRAAPAIEGLTDEIVHLEDWQWNKALKDLESLDLVTLTQAEGHPLTLSPPHLVTIDAHPLVREYFAARLREHAPEAYRAAHGRLFDHLCETTEHRPDTLAGLQPLYQAVTHGCLAGRQQEACDKVYHDRILRGTGSDGFYSRRKLGAIGADLGAVAAFFEAPWRRLSPNLSEADRAWLLAVAAFSLRALGRLTEAREPMRAGLERRVELQDWKNAAISASNLSELDTTLGALGEAVADSRRAVDFADRSEDAFQRMSKRTTAADALHQRGERDEARALFEEAEQMQAEWQPHFPLLYSLPGFWYTDLILAPAERAAWQVLVSSNPQSAIPNPQWSAACDEAARRAAINIREHSNLSLLDIALDHLTLARAGLDRAVLESEPPEALDLRDSAIELDRALGSVRQANAMDHLPKALLTASLFAWLREQAAGSTAAEADFVPDSLQLPAEDYLAEAELIAARGPMPLYLADVYLHRARLFRDRDALANARQLIDKQGYGRRRDELADAEAAAARW